MTSDPAEAKPIDTTSKEYKEITPIILAEIEKHKNSIETVKTQFSVGRLAPQLTWQPCCNGTFPFNCYCTDPKYPYQL